MHGERDKSTSPLNDSQIPIYMGLCKGERADKGSDALGYRRGTPVAEYPKTWAAEVSATEVLCEARRH